MAQQLGAEPPEPRDPPLARGRGRISRVRADVAFWQGTCETSIDVRYTAAFGVKADISLRFADNRDL
jgi:hypothetical protein